MLCMYVYICPYGAMYAYVCTVVHHLIVSLDTHQPCVSTGALQALLGELYLALRAKIAPVSLPLAIIMCMLLLDFQ